MLAEDRTAFIEQLEVRRHDRRVAKHRRRRAQAELAVLRAEWEARAAGEALAKMEQELASLLEPASSSGGGRRDARRRHSLERRIASMRARALAKQQESLAARRRLRELDPGGRRERPAPGAKVFRLHSAQHHLECSERRFVRLSRSQSDLPVLVARKDGRSWWWYADRFWWDEDGLPAPDVRTIVLDRDLRLEQRAAEIAEARATLFGEESRPAADAPVSAVVRFKVWCRDGGRCVDCSTAEGLVFDEILPAAEGGAATAANVELRCEACRGRRAKNRARARVSRARIDVSHGR